MSDNNHPAPLTISIGGKELHLDEAVALLDAEIKKGCGPGSPSLTPRLDGSTWVTVTFDGFSEMAAFVNVIAQFGPEELHQRIFVSSVGSHEQSSWQYSFHPIKKLGSDISVLEIDGLVSLSFSPLDLPVVFSTVQGINSRIKELAGALAQKNRECPDCGVQIGELHRLKCDVEPCPYCGQQLLSCEHFFLGTGAPPPDSDRIPWSGEWPGVAEAREFGWYSRRNPDGPGWVPCQQGEPGASPDLCRLCTEARWDRNQKRWVR
ncbi:MAG: hypothetical protein K2R98_30660 [Gemmataceae bacterium]|nr:hypothetical protein [Gemmataceae bacterium]